MRVEVKHTLAARNLLISLTGFAYVAVFAFAWLRGFAIDYSSIASPVAVGLGFVIGVGSICTWRGMTTIRAGIECLGYGLLLTVPLVLSTYLAAGIGMPLADPLLARIDGLLGVNWPELIRWIDGVPLLPKLLHWAYRSFSYQLLLLPVILVVYRKCARAYEMVSAYALTCLASSVVSIWTPALGTYVFYTFDFNQLRNIDVTYGFFFLDQFDAVRTDPSFVWRLHDSSGIVTFPSVHAAGAVLCAWAAWDIKLLRYPAAILNIGMAFSTLPEANHYFIDIVAGVVIAIVAIVTVKHLVKRRFTSLVPDGETEERPASPQPSPEPSGSMA